MKEHRHWYMIRLFMLLMVILLTLILIPCSAADKTLLHSWEAKSLSVKTLVVDESTVPIYYGDPTYYITNTSKFSRQYLLYVGASDNTQNRLIQLGGQVYEVSFSSSAPEVASIDEYGLLTFWSEGSVVFTVTIGDSSVNMPVQVLEGPWVIEILHEKMPTEDVVRALGFPQHRTYSQVEWPNRATVLDNIFYSFGGTSTIVVEHWHHDQYPSLLFGIAYHRLLTIYNKGWDSYEGLPYRLGIPRG
jgi:hypothetical protein